MDAVIERARSVLSHVFLPNIDLGSIQPMLDLTAKAPDFFFPMMGLHPCHVKEDYKSVLDQMEVAFTTGKYYGVGETGLDLYWDKSLFQEQKDALRVQCRWAKEMGLPLILHGREATPELIELIREEQDGRLKGIFHCFVGSIDEAAAIKDLGFLMGIGGVITYKNSGLAATCAQLDLNDLVLETDSPYLPPVPHRGKRNESSYIPIIGRKLSDAHETTLPEIARITSANALRLFGLLEQVAP